MIILMPYLAGKGQNNFTKNYEVARPELIYRKKTII